MKVELPYNYIAIEGNIGAGKTTFCKMIKEEYECDLILEEFDDNPFLPLFYKDQERFAFTVELFFMTERYKQLERHLLNRGLFSDFTLADYTFTKTKLFAGQNLPPAEFRLFNQMFEVLNQNFPRPDILVYFHRDVDELLRNIDKRGRAYEKDITPEYLKKVQDSYFDYFRGIISFPILVIDLKDIDFKDNRQNYKEIKYLLSKTYRPGVHRITLSL